MFVKLRAVSYFPHHKAILGKCIIESKEIISGWPRSNNKALRPNNKETTAIHHDFYPKKQIVLYSKMVMHGKYEIAKNPQTIYDELLKHYKTIRKCRLLGR